jgi:serine/threonine protein kinase
LKKGQRLNDRYEVLEDINTGSFGHVVLCRDTAHGDTKVAVKVQDRPEVRYHQGMMFGA